jgi:hypothetical protein
MASSHFNRCYVTSAVETVLLNKQRINYDKDIKVKPVYKHLAIKAYKASGDYAPRILALDTRWR